MAEKRERAGRLEGKIAIITGGTSGIGRASVLHFLEEGASVVCADIQDDKGMDLAREHGVKLSYVHTDVSKEEDVKRMVAHALSTFGRLDILFNNAGINGPLEKIETLDMELFERLDGILLKGVLLGCKYAAPHMIAQKSGSIINTASIGGMAAMRGGMGGIAYPTLKAAVINLTRVLALQLAPHFVRVNAVCPGFIPTPIQAEGIDPKRAEDFALAIKEEFAELQPIRRPGSPSDIAYMAGFLASDQAGFITGQSIAVDGGITAGYAGSRGKKRFDISEFVREYSADV